MYLLNAACRNAACQNAACHNAACQNAEFEPKGVWAAMRNWKSWGASRLFQEDPFASAHQFRMQEMQQLSREWQLGWKQLWDYAARSAA